MKWFGQAKDDSSIRAKMPKVHALVTLQRAGVTAAANGAIAALEANRFVVQSQLRGLPGQNYVVTFQTPNGKFRFVAKCQESRDEGLIFNYPAKIDTLESGPAPSPGRQTVRLDTTVRGEWRVAPAGKGNGVFSRGTISDISRTGASLVLDREFPTGTQVELRLALNSRSAPLLLLGEVMRAKRVDASSKTLHGLKFLGVSPDDDKSILEYINRRQAERRERGLS